MLTEARRLRELRVVTYGRPDGIGEVSLQLVQNLRAFLYPTVVEGGDYAPYKETIPGALHLLHAGQEVSYPLKRQHLHRDRYQDLVDVEEAVHVEDVPRRRRVQQYEIVAPEAFEGLAEHQLGAHIPPRDHALHARERRSASDHEQVLAGFHLHVIEAGVALHKLGQSLTRLDAQAFGHLPLSVAIHQGGRGGAQGPRRPRAPPGA